MTRMGSDTEEDVSIIGRVGESVLKAGKGIAGAFTGMKTASLDNIEGTMRSFEGELEDLINAQTKDLRKSYPEEYSSTEQIDEITLQQTKDTNGFIQVVGADNKPYPSAIHSGITIPLTTTPERLVTIPIRGIKKDQINSALKQPHNDVKPMGVREIPNIEDGSISIMYSIKSNINDSDEGAIIEVRIPMDQPEQVMNIANDIAIQGDRDGFFSITSQRLTTEVRQMGEGSNGSFKMSYITEESLAKGIIQPEGELDIEVRYEDGMYNTYLGNDQLNITEEEGRVKPLHSLNQVLAELIDYQMVYLGFKK